MGLFNKKETFNPRERFPEEIVKLHDERGVWPAIYIGPIYPDEAQARLAIESLKKELEKIPPEPGDLLF